MKKILFVLSYSKLGGAETRAVDLAVNLKEKAEPVFIIYGSKNDAVQKVLEQHDIAFIDRPKFNWNNPKGMFFLILNLFKEVSFLVKTCLRIRPNSMISFCADANILVYCTNLIIRNKRIFWCQEDDFIQWRWKRLFLKGIRGSKNVISVSNFITNQIVLKTGRSKDRIITITNSIDVSYLNVNKVTSNKIRISVVGHISRIKNQGYVINAIREIVEVQKITNLELNLYGNISDSNYWDEIKIDAPWLIYNGYKPKNFIYNSTDILIIPSISEAFSLVLQEGEFFSTTVFCANIPIFKKNSFPNVSLFDLSDPNDLISQLIPILADPLRIISNEDKRDVFNQKYSDYLKSYEEILLS